ncbi:hypothetical protein ACU7RR_000170 [Providencia stuartii]|uniref:Uncharacterized protein n=1 Tax=Providencia stuartii (strain MRSN 2154) TaxID=1157951 RepID=A0A140NGU4_PROSM|nr:MULTISPECIES: hypothetical protein [Providencia]AFH92101.1 hypothetical protein S70_01010 [Providencia stuartii MRSN 2154]MDE8747215.1 hypothetical protein [Providencia thailandensis]MDE8766221.1 hypothetical protein [Providencia thailandensis]MDE8778459.1 hypothetical protein [Providencia thailandensis]MDE8782784.1 hypothetical protein [Providencia thailandensis]
MLTATLWVALGVIGAALITRGVKISEFRQAWIDGLRSDIAEYTSKAHEWIDIYLEFNNQTIQEKKIEITPKLERLKYDALHIHNRISLRFKPGNKKANQLLKHLLDLLDPSKLDTEQSNAYSRWRELSDKAVQEARFLLKEEWEYTKNPLKKRFLKDKQ